VALLSHFKHRQTNAARQVQIAVSVWTPNPHPQLNSWFARILQLGDPMLGHPPWYVQVSAVVESEEAMLCRNRKMTMEV